MFNLKNIFAAATLSLITMTSASASSIALDSFDYPFGGAANTSGNGSLNLSASGTGAFVQDSEFSPHGTVTASLFIESDDNVTQDASAAAGGGSLFFSMPSKVKASLGLFYTNPFADLQNPDTFLDLTNDGITDSFYFDVSSIDINFTLELFVISDVAPFADYVAFTDALYMEDAGSYTGFDTSALTGLNGVSSLELSSIANPQVVSTAFTDFETGVNGGADFSAVTAIFALITSSSDATDLTLDEVGVVPEPTTLAIFGLGLLGLGLRRRNA